MASVSLAEPRRRQKWTLNPRGNLWANDENKFGHKLMEKMGWKKGKGLGANQNGMVDTVKIRQKDNQKGIGFDGHDDTWLAHQDDFQAVLAALNVEHGAVGAEMTDSEKKVSLEAISRKSKRRVHYQKFVKGKDSSNYSADDLGCILGTKSEKVGVKAKAVELEASGVEEDTGKFTQATGSYQDYFASKMAALKAQGKYQDVPSWTEEPNNPKSLGLGAGGDRLIDREIERESLLNPSYLREAVDKEVGENKKRLKKNKRDCDENAAPVKAAVIEVLEEEVEKFKKKKKSKKHKMVKQDISEEEEVVEEVHEESTNEKLKKKKTKKSKKEKSSDEEKEVVEDSGCDEKEMKNKKTKKSKKEKNKHKNDFKDLDADVIDAHVDAAKEENEQKRKAEDDNEEASTKKKKKKSKKNKEASAAEPTNENDASGGFKGSNLMVVPGYGN